MDNLDPHHRSKQRRPSDGLARLTVHLERNDEAISAQAECDWPCWLTTLELELELEPVPA